MKSRDGKQIPVFNQQFVKKSSSAVDTEPTITSIDTPYSKVSESQVVGKESGIKNKT